MGTPLPPPQKGGAPPQIFFRPMFIVVKRLNGWLKLILGMEVGLNPGDFVLDGDPAPLPT